MYFRIMFIVMNIYLATSQCELNIFGVVLRSTDFSPTLALEIQILEVFPLI